MEQLGVSNLMPLTRRYHGRGMYSPIIGLVAAILLLVSSLTECHADARDADDADGNNKHILYSPVEEEADDLLQAVIENSRMQDDDVWSPAFHHSSTVAYRGCIARQKDRYLMDGRDGHNKYSCGLPSPWSRGAQLSFSGSLENDPYIRRHSDCDVVSEYRPTSDFLEPESLSAARNLSAPYVNNVTLFFIVNDLCAMGHITKDATRLASFLLDYFRPPRENTRAYNASMGRVRVRLQLTLVYGNACMRPLHQGGSVYGPTRVFQNVLLGWFRAVVREDSVIMRILRAWGVEIVVREAFDPVVDSGAHDTAKIRLGAEEMYFSEMPQTFCGFPQGSEEAEGGRQMTIFLFRFERWRWFRTPLHASVFRRALLDHYGVPLLGSENAVDGRRAHPLTVTVLRRSDDRHFNEPYVYQRLKQRLEPHGVQVNLTVFDRKRPEDPVPPPHKEQLKILHRSSVLLAAHGAGLAGALAMPPGSVLIELLPHNFRYYMYEELADLLDVKYIGYESHITWPPNCCRSWPADRNSDFMPELKTKLTYINGINAMKCKKCDIFLPNSDLDNIIDDAITHVLLHAANALND